MQDNRTAVNASGCWDDFAEAQLLVIAGNRLIAREVVEGIRGWWRRVMR